MDDEEPITRRLHDQQLAQEQAARDALAGAETEEEARADLRRADKARYLREKLEEQDRADRAVHDEG
jgi:hypothetical protein